MKIQIASARLVGITTTGLTTFALNYLNLGFGGSFVKVWKRPWGLAHLIVIPLILAFGPKLRELIPKHFVMMKWVAATIVTVSLGACMMRHTPKGESSLWAKLRRFMPEGLLDKGLCKSFRLA